MKTSFLTATTTTVMMIQSQHGFRRTFAVWIQHNPSIVTFSSSNNIHQRQRTTHLRVPFGRQMTFDRSIASTEKGTGSPSDSFNKIDVNLTTEKTVQEIQMTNDIQKIIQQAIHAVDPAVAVKRSLRMENTKNKGRLFVSGDNNKHNRTKKRDVKSYMLDEYERIVVVGIGKAAAPMVTAVVETVMTSSTTTTTTSKKVSGLVITKTGHVTNQQRTYLEDHNIKVREASHPIPCERGVSASYELLDLVSTGSISSESVPRKSSQLVIACISGGGSALFCTPQPPLTLNDLKATNTALIQSGWPISVMNTIRTVLEKGKGGGLARAALNRVGVDGNSKSDVLSLILSDVVGDPLDIIASGPTVIQSDTTRCNAIQEAYHLIKNCCPEHVQFPRATIDFITKEYEHMLASRKFIVLDQDSNNDWLSSRCFNQLVGNNAVAVEAAASMALSLGYHPIILGTQLQGEASTVAQILIGTAQNIQQPTTSRSINYDGTFPVALIAGGETTVTLPNDDSTTGSSRLGGRNQELALAAALALKDSRLRQIVIASVGTDGNDGPTDAAGAVVDGGTVDRLDTAIMNLSSANTKQSAKLALQYHNAYPYLNQTDNNGDSPLIKTGPTGTNVADIIVILIHSK